jgi:hypothetical protein
MLTCQASSKALAEIQQVVKRTIALYTYVRVVGVPIISEERSHGHWLGMMREDVGFDVGCSGSKPPGRCTLPSLGMSQDL